MIARPLLTPDRIRVHVSALDPISAAGVAAQFRPTPGIELVDASRIDAETVAVVVADAVDEDCLRALRALRRQGVEGVLAVVSRVDDAGLLAAVEAGARGLIRRRDATPQQLVAAVRAAAAGEAAIPADLMARVLDHVGRLQRQVLAPRGLTFSGLRERELQVLRLLAEGDGTPEIGAKLYCSERTVKSLVHDITTRLGLRNRAHAVAYAIREGLI